MGHATVGVSVGRQSEKLLEKWGQYQAVQQKALVIRVLVELKKQTGKDEEAAASLRAGGR